MDHANPANENTGTKSAKGSTKAEAAITDGAGRSQAQRAERPKVTDATASMSRRERGRTVRPKQAGTGEIATVSGRRDVTPPKTAQDHDAAASQAKPGPDPAPPSRSSKLDQLVTLLRAPGGATLPELQHATGWQAHSVRGALAGALRKKGYSIASERPEGGLRRYRILEAS